MSNRRCIVLRDESLVDLGDPLSVGPLSLSPTQPELSAEVLDLGTWDLAKLKQDPKVLAVAETMPTALAEPVAMATIDAAVLAAGVEWGVAAVGADKSTLTGAGVTVAVLDTGIDLAHPAFAGLSIVSKDFTGTGVADVHGHGTHCAGTICGRDVAGRRIGVARGIKKLLVGKVLDDHGRGDTEALVQGFNWAMDQGAQVVSMSIGFDFPGLVDRMVQAGQPVKVATNAALRVYRNTLRLFDALVRVAEARGVILVAAAGNESNRPAGLELDTAPPAAADGVIAVGAVGQSVGGLGVATFSNTGPQVVGPGVDIVSAAPGGGLARMSGTSMSTPHVAGVAALWAENLLATFGSVSSRTLITRVVGRASPVGFVAGVDPGDIGSGMVVSPP